MENPSRRRVLTAGLTGAAATALFGTRASATTPTDPPATAGAGEQPAASAESSPTTVAPDRPTSGDVTLLAFAQSAELAARDLYAAAIDTDVSGDGVEVLHAARNNHQAAADALAAEIGGDAPQTADEGIVTAAMDAFSSGDLTTVADAGYELENALVATHTELVGQLENLDGASNVAAILVAEAQMAAVMAHLSGNGDDPAAMFDNSIAALAIPSEG